MGLFASLLKILPKPYFRCCFSSVSKPSELISKKTPKGILDSSDVSRICSSIGSINSRLINLELTSAFLSGKLDLTKFSPVIDRDDDHVATNRPMINQEVKLPGVNKDVVIAPTAHHVIVKNFIIEIPAKILDPVHEIRKIEDPVKIRPKKYAVRMIVLRRKKMKKHKLKRLWERMYLKFRAARVRREKKKELTFRYMLMDKIAVARKFDAEKYVSQYLVDYHTPLMPKTYKGSRKPAWLIKEILEQDILDEKEKAIEGKSITTKKQLILPGETVEEFIKRTWNK